MISHTIIKCVQIMKKIMRSVPIIPSPLFLLKNANHPQGVSITSDNISSIVDKGINIGSYSDESNAFIKFEAIVIDKGYKGLDSVKLTNWAKISSGNNTKISFSKISVFID